MNSIEGESRKVLLSVFLFLASVITSFSQTIVKGTIRDAQSQQPLQSVSILFKGGKGATTDASGNYTIASNQSYNTIIVSYVGYKPVSRSISPNKEQVLDINLQVADAKKHGSCTLEERKILK